MPPERLCRFRAEEWPVPPLPDGRTGWQAEAWDVMGPFHVWRAARRVWSADHGDALGDFLERLVFENRVRREHYAAVHQVVG
jgi:hypothetical protein